MFLAFVYTVRTQFCTTGFSTDRNLGKQTGLSLPTLPILKDTIFKLKLSMCW